MPLIRRPAVQRDATHLVVSIGGNDALDNANLLDAPARSTAADARKHLPGGAIAAFAPPDRR